MAEVLRSRLLGWNSIVPEHIRVEQVGRTGGGRVFKLSNRARTPSDVAALHVLSDRLSGTFREVFVERLRAAHQAFAEADLGVEWLAEDPQQTWFVERWGGNVIHDQELSVPIVEEIGRYLARAHAIDTGWFSPTQHRLTELYPALALAGDGGMLWIWACMYGLDQMTDSAQRRHAAVGPAPASEVGARRVTCHLDPSAENITRGSDGRWRFIDLDFAAVNYAALDLAQLISKPYCHQPSLKAAAMRGYLQGLGFDATEDEVFALCLDVERMNAHPLRIGIDPSNPLADHIVAIADRALADPELARDIVANGFRACAPMLVLGDMLVAPGGQRRPVPASIHRRAPDQAFRRTFRLNWDGTIAVPSCRGLLGERGDGRIVVMDLEAEGHLRVALGDGAVPITGLRAPLSAPGPLTLAGAYAGRAVVAGESELDPAERAVGYLRIGPIDDALHVHFEPDGFIRLADRPHLVLSHYGGRTRPGTRIVIVAANGHQSQRFRVHDDATISPVLHRDAVFGVDDSGLVLVAASADSSVLEFELAGTMQPPMRGDGSGAPRGPRQAILELASHPGMALSAEPWPAREDVLRPVIAPVARAARWIVDAHEIRLVDDGGVLAVGLPFSYAPEA